jgi:hypothetical protein
MATINGVNIRVMFDRGVLRCFRCAAERRGQGRLAGSQRAGYSRIGQHGQDLDCPFASFKLGDEEIRNTRLRIG